MHKDKELELLRRRRIAELMKRLRIKEAEEGRKAEDPKRILRRIVTDRAWEVLKVAESQYPEATRRVEEHLARLV